MHLTKNQAFSIYRVTDRGYFTSRDRLVRVCQYADINYVLVKGGRKQNIRKTRLKRVQAIALPLVRQAKRIIGPLVENPPNPTVILDELFGTKPQKEEYGTYLEFEIGRLLGPYSSLLSKQQTDVVNAYVKEVEDLSNKVEEILKEVEPRKKVSYEVFERLAIMIDNPTKPDLVKRVEALKF